MRNQISWSDAAARDHTQERVYFAGRILGWTIIGTGLWYTLQFGIEQAFLEQKYPSPSEWTFLTRVSFRRAKDAEERWNASNSVPPDILGKHWLETLSRLEDARIDGAGIMSGLRIEEGMYVDSLGKAGTDITDEPETWRRGYHEVLMGAAKAAEVLESWVYDRKQQQYFQRAYMVGPSNPNPMPFPKSLYQRPLEEDCDPTYKSPEVYYMKILTTQGFTSRQKMDAALSFANYFSFKGFPQSAENMFAWVIDIANSSYTADAPLPIEKSTGIVTLQTAIPISNNVILAATAYATYQAQRGDFAVALPVFLSILRAQQSLHPADPSIFSSEPSSVDLSTYMGLLKAAFTPPSYNPSQPNGDEPATRTPAAICAEAGSMAHIGEIIFASTPSSEARLGQPSSEQTAGLSWTRDAVDLAEETFKSLPTVTSSGASSLVPFSKGPDRSRKKARQGSFVEEEAKARCGECLVEGLKNWRKMIGRIVEGTEAVAVRSSELATIKAATDRRLPMEGEKTEHEMNTNMKNARRASLEGNTTGRGWFWGSAASSSQNSASFNTGRWTAELRNVIERDSRIKMMLRQEGIRPTTFS